MSNFTVTIEPGETCKMADRCSKSETCSRVKQASQSKVYCYEFSTFEGKRPSEFDTSSNYKIIHG